MSSLSRITKHEHLTGLEIAVVGMACHFPGARNIDEYWQNLKNGVESITFFTDEELAAANLDRVLMDDPNYVKAGGIIEDIDFFDASFFGFTPREAEAMDPQHRLFLECAWEALEHSAHDPGSYPGRIGVYAGAGMNTYLLNNLYANRDYSESVGRLPLLLANDKDFLATRVSYKLNLLGPSVTIQSACSTSLVAIHMACQSLLGGECDLALAGGITIRVPQNSGYLYQEGMIFSPDGHCRAFDAKAQGSVEGNGVGVVVLKRLADALKDRDCIQAVVKGSAINNDGSMKAGYTAPSVEGQAAVIRAAQTIAGVGPEAISYLETHGSGTPLGDAIELAALNKVFSRGRERNFLCAIGSVKTNIGHLDIAAGVASFIKTVLALKHGMLPPSLHFQAPGPQTNLQDKLFYVNTTLREWKCDSQPRRAGVSSFGIGGTNAHLILEEAPNCEPSRGSRGWHLLTISAMSTSALEESTTRLANYLEQSPEANVADVAYTLNVGRKAFGHRRMLLCQDREDALSGLSTLDPKRVLSVVSHNNDPNYPIAFMFPGLGDQYVGMAQGLYRDERIFREQVERCGEILKPHVGLDLVGEVLYAVDHAGPTEQTSQSKLSNPPSGLDLRRMLKRDNAANDERARRLSQTSLAQPSIFVIEYALARLWMEWGVRPWAMLGYSIGEYVAACLAGVLSLEDALMIVAKRAQLIQELPEGAMLSVPLPEREVQPLLGKRLSLAAINGPALCVVAGPADDVYELERELAQRSVAYRRIQTTHAFHSKQMEPIYASFIEVVKTIPLNAPKIPYLSNVTGTWITADESTDPVYWAKHLCQCVQLDQNLTELWKEPQQILLEVGPGQTLSSLALQHPGSATNAIVLPSVRHEYDNQPDESFLKRTVGKLWLAGTRIDWSAFHSGEQRRRLALPTYPFERQRYWVEPPADGDGQRRRGSSAVKTQDISQWFYLPSWKASLAPTRDLGTEPSPEKTCWLIFTDACGLGEEIARRLESEGHEVIRIQVGNQYRKISERIFQLNPGDRGDYDLLSETLHSNGQTPQTIVHCWSISEDNEAQSNALFFNQLQSLGYYSLIYLCQALAQAGPAAESSLIVLSNHTHNLAGEQTWLPEKATLLAPCSVIPQEFPHIICSHMDVEVPKAGGAAIRRLARRLLAEIALKPVDTMIAYRGNQRWVKSFEKVRVEGGSGTLGKLRDRGVYLLTGGLGRVGLLLAEYLAQMVRAKLILINSSGFPARAAWGEWLETHSDNEDTSRKIRKLLKIEDLGADILIAKADVAQEEQMRAVVQLADQRFGKIDGLIHVAGITNDLQLITEVDKVDSERQFQSKVYGLYTLRKVLAGRELDFRLLFSSMASILGGPGLVSYTAASLFTDSFALNESHGGDASWLSVNWDGWLFEDEAAQPNNGMIAEYFMTPKEAKECFRRVLTRVESGQIIVSTGSLFDRVNRWRRRENLPAAETQSGSSYPRPTLRSAYVAPQSNVEQAIAEIWSRTLGVEQVGVHDNFFELGGDSLLGTKIVSWLDQGFQVKVSLRKLWEYSTVAELALLVEELIIDQLLDQSAHEAISAGD